jgi:tape measure domain-containing protein
MASKVAEAYLQIRAQDQTAGDLGRIRSNLANQMSSMATVTGAILGANIAGRLAAIPQELGSAMLSANMQMARMRTAFTVMMGSSDLAQKHLEDLRKFGAATPFEMPGLVRASQQLQQAGVSADEVIPILTDFGNAASAGVVPLEEALPRITKAITDMKNSGRVLGGELMQLSNVGINARKIMQEQLGMSADQFRQAQRTGSLTAEVGIAALRKGLREKFGEKWVPDDAGGMKRLPSMMEQMSVQMEGLWSNFQDILGQVTLRGGERLYKSMEGYLKRLMDFLQSTQGEAFISGLVDAMGRFSDMLAAAAPAVGGFIAGFGGVAISVTAAGAALSAVGAIVGFLGGPLTIAAGAAGLFAAGLASAVQSAQFGPRLLAAWELVSGAVSNIATRVMASFSMLSSAGGSFWETVQGFATSAFEAIAGFIAANQDTFVEWGAIIVQTVQGAIETIQAIWQAGVEFMQSVWQWFGGGTGTIWNWIRDLVTGVLAEINVTFHSWGESANLVWTQIALGLSRAADWMKDAFLGLVAAGDGAVKAIGAMFQALWDNLGKGLPALATAVATQTALAFQEGFESSSALKAVGDSPLTMELRRQRDQILRERDKLREALRAERVRATAPEATTGPALPGTLAPTPGKKAEEEGGGATGKAMKIALVGFADYSKKIQEAVTGGGTLALQRNILGEAKKTSAATENLGAKLDKTNEKLQGLKDMQGGFK